jgi:hypothetical protein
VNFLGQVRTTEDSRDKKGCRIFMWDLLQCFDKEDTIGPRASQDIPPRHNSLCRLSKEKFFSDFLENNVPGEEEGSVGRSWLQNRFAKRGSDGS